MVRRGSYHVATDRMSWRDRLGDLRDKTTFLKYVPFLNFFYFMIDDTPKKDDVETLLNTLGLISALMLTLSPLIISTVESDELLRADGDYFGFGYTGPYNQVIPGAEIGKYGCLPITGTSLTDGMTQISVWVMGRVFISIACLMIALLSAMLLLVSISTLPQLKDLKDDFHSRRGSRQYGQAAATQAVAMDEDGRDNACRNGTGAGPARRRASMKRRTGGIDRQSDRVFEESFPLWWSIAWVPVVFVLFPFLVYGMLAFGQSIFALALIRIPNDYREKVCREAGWVFSHTDLRHGTAVFVNGSFPDPGAYRYTDCRENIDCIFYGTSTLMFPLVIVFCACCMGYASLFFERGLNKAGHRVQEEAQARAEAQQIRFGF
mmetsp:Transcript_19430/g.50519  ORF Transcript_19430/g.50519 Transcript_19430/m.50519 type:complete len:377 (+) Transcript_19430:183-1313(+)